MSIFYCVKSVYTDAGAQGAEIVDSSRFSVVGFSWEQVQFTPGMKG